MRRGRGEKGEVEKMIYFLYLSGANAGAEKQGITTEPACTLKESKSQKPS